jgi:RNA polymerase sigma-70 factor (ECF subfamily)
LFATLTNRFEHEHDKNSIFLELFHPLFVLIIIAHLKRRNGANVYLKQMNPNQEKKIISQVQSGDAQAFEPIVHHYQSAVFRILANLVEGAMIEDLAQDVFLSAFAQIGRFDPQKGSFRSWLYAIARNRALNARRKKRETLLPQPPETVQTRTPVDDLMVKELFRHLDTVLAAMPFQDRAIFVWAELEGLSYGEIARIENLPLGTVKSRLARIRARLKHSLDQMSN